MHITTSIPGTKMYRNTIRRTAGTAGSDFTAISRRTILIINLRKSHVLRVLLILIATLFVSLLLQVERKRNLSTDSN